MRTVTWTLTREYTDEEYEALEISEVNDLHKRGYYEVFADWSRMGSMDDMHLGVSTRNAHGVTYTYAAPVIRGARDTPESVAKTRKHMWPDYTPS